MKSFNFCILVFLLYASSLSYGQTFQAGLKIDAERIAANVDKFPSSSFQVRTAYFTGTAFWGNDLAFEARMGYNWEDYYEGMEAGIFSKYYYKDLYAIGGIVYHHINKENPEWIDLTYFSVETDIFMPAAGLGFNPGRHFAVELMFQYGFGKEIGFYYHPAPQYGGNFHPLPELPSPINLDWVTKIGISYSFSL